MDMFQNMKDASLIGCERSLKKVPQVLNVFLGKRITFLPNAIMTDLPGATFSGNRPGRMRGFRC